MSINLFIGLIAGIFNVVVTSNTLQKQQIWLSVRDMSRVRGIGETDIEYLITMYFFAIFAFTFFGIFKDFRFAVIGAACYPVMSRYIWGMALFSDCSPTTTVNITVLVAYLICELLNRFRQSRLAADGQVQAIEAVINLAETKYYLPDTDRRNRHFSKNYYEEKALIHDDFGLNVYSNPVYKRDLSSVHVPLPGTRPRKRRGNIRPPVPDNQQ